VYYVALLPDNDVPPRPRLKPQELHGITHFFLDACFILGGLCAFLFVTGERPKFPCTWVDNFDELIELKIALFFFL
jgi:hypothetical protein